MKVLTRQDEKIKAISIPLVLSYSPIGHQLVQDSENRLFRQGEN